jgi:hypothetical protein
LGSDLPSRAFFAGDSRDTAECPSGERWDGGLHPDLDSLKRTQGKIGNELSRSTSGEVERSLVAISSVLSGQIGVELLEKLIASIFESTLSLR